MSSDTSLVYKNIFVYRTLMNVIYGGKYKARFQKIIEVIERLKPKSVLELCFGDTIIADYCKNKNIVWEGYDINQNFVQRATHLGYNAKCQDILMPKSFEKNDLCIISGSLYHFKPDERLQLLKKILASSSRLLISEPVINLSDQKGLIGYVARRSANAGKGNENFRYNEQSLKAALDELGLTLNFRYTVVGFIKKDLLILVEKNETN